MEFKSYESTIFDLIDLNLIVSFLTLNYDKRSLKQNFLSSNLSPIDSETSYR